MNSTVNINVTDGARKPLVIIWSKYRNRLFKMFPGCEVLLVTSFEEYKRAVWKHRLRYFAVAILKTPALQKNMKIALSAGAGTVFVYHSKRNPDIEMPFSGKGTWDHFHGIARFKLSGPFFPDRKLSIEGHELYDRSRFLGELDIDGFFLPAFHQEESGDRPYETYSPDFDRVELRRAENVHWLQNVVV